MKTKEKQVENANKKTAVKITIKNIVIILLFVAFALLSIQFYYYYFADSKTYGKETSSNETELKISNASIIDLDKILNENSSDNKKEEIEKQETTLEYITKYKTNTQIPKGIIQVVQEGREGRQEVVTKKKYENNELVAEEQLSAKVTKASVNKIVEIGGGNFSNKYTIKVGDTLYVTSTRLSVMSEPNDSSQKVSTLSKADQLKLTLIQDEWYKISSGNTIGWVKAECTTYINPNEPVKEEEPSKSEGNSSLATDKPKEQIISKLSFDMKLNSPSGLTLDQFKKILNDSKDTNKILSDNAQYFYYIEEQYNINGLFVAAMAIHESGWATSKISIDKKNLFGYGAYDSNPYNGAYTFTSYSESIDLIARVLVKYYLNSEGTSIYGGEKATGKYYNGPTLSGVNTRYATDKNWANAVYKHMSYLYNKL